jgi:hypothetical protein
MTHRYPGQLLFHMDPQVRSGPQEEWIPLKRGQGAAEGAWSVDRHPQPQYHRGLPQLQSQLTHNHAAPRVAESRD